MDTNDTKHVLVIGTGSIGERHTRCFLATDRCDVTVCEINDELRADMADRYRLSGTFSDLDPALQRRQPRLRISQSHPARPGPPRLGKTAGARDVQAGVAPRDAAHSDRGCT